MAKSKILKIVRLVVLDRRGSMCDVVKMDDVTEAQHRKLFVDERNVEWSCKIYGWPLNCLASLPDFRFRFFSRVFKMTRLQTDVSLYSQLLSVVTFNIHFDLPLTCNARSYSKVGPSGVAVAL